MKLKRLLISAMSALMVSCATDSESIINGVGELAVSLEMQTEMLTPEGRPAGIEVPYRPATEDISLTIESADGAYGHTWDNFETFPQADDYYAGEYRITASTGSYIIEGYDRPVFSGSLLTAVEQGRRTDATVTMDALVAFVTAAAPQSSGSGIELLEMDIHTPGGIYHRLNAEAPADSYLCLRPGLTTVYATVSRDGSRELRIEALQLTTIPGALYSVEAALSGDELTVKCAGKKNAVTLSESFFQAAPPVMESTWTDEPVVIPEGDSSQWPLVAEIENGGRPLSHLYLSMSSASLAAREGFTPQVDLLNLTPPQRDFLLALGLEFSVSESGGCVDFTDFLSGLVYLTADTDESVFTLEAVDLLGVSAAPLALTVITEPVDIEITGTEAAVMGVDRAGVHISCPSAGFATHVDIEILDPATGLYQRVPVTVKNTGQGMYDVEFAVPPGSQPVDARVLYCDEERARITVHRAQPDFSLEVDAFASTAEVRVMAADPSLTKVITSLANIYINGHEAPLYQRSPDEGILSIIGLSPSTSYTFTATMMSGVANPVFTKAVSVRTETTRQLPNADFEERENGVIYPDLPSGGRYSQTTVEIFNWQHRVTFATESPEGWATTNDKTFCLKSTNHNTWYMQPSVESTREVASSNTYSAKISTVAFDPTGEKIPDYAQTGQPFLTYSPIIPDIKYRAAGKLFLGSYKFDASKMEETYKQGISWNTRPRSLNGYYRFLPSTSNRNATALVRVELSGMVDGTETVIASNELKLPLASDMTAFNVPLTYGYFGVKATGIKVMFASSSDCGTIAEETARLITDPDPRTATSRGGTLWIDNITLAY